MTEHAQRLEELGLSDWPHTVYKVCANQESFSEAGRARLAKRLQAYARRHGIGTDQKATLKDVCADLVQRVSSFAPEPLSPTDQLWFLENVADQLRLDKKSRKDVQRAVQRRVEEHVVKDGWSWKHALVVVLAALASSSGARGMQVPVCDQTSCIAQPLNSVVAQLQTDAIAPQQLAWSLSDDLRDYMEQRVPTSVTGPVTVAEPWIQDLTKSMNVYYEAVRDHEQGQLGRAQRSALETMLTDVEYATVDEEMNYINEVSTSNDPDFSRARRDKLIKEGLTASTLKRDIRQLLQEPTVNNEQLLLLFGRYAAWTTNTRKYTDEEKRKLFSRGGRHDDTEGSFVTLRRVKNLAGGIVDDVIFIPSFAPVTIEELNRMAGLRIFLLGMSSNELELFDDNVSQPFLFLQHDIVHSSDIYGNLLISRRLQIKHFAYNADKPNVEENVEPIPWDELESEQIRYREFITHLQQIEDASTVDEIENLFFFLWHEAAIPLNTLARMTPDDYRFFEVELGKLGKSPPQTATKLLFNHFRASPLAPRS